MTIGLGPPSTSLLGNYPLYPICFYRKKTQNDFVATYYLVVQQCTNINIHIYIYICIYIYIYMYISFVLLFAQIDNYCQNNRRWIKYMCRCFSIVLTPKEECPFTVFASPFFIRTLFNWMNALKGINWGIWNWKEIKTSQRLIGHVCRDNSYPWGPFMDRIVFVIWMYNK